MPRFVSGRMNADKRDAGNFQHEIHTTINQWFGDDPQKWPSRLRAPIGGEDTSIVSQRCGLHSEMGVIVAGSQRADFPGQTESLLLSVASNEAVIGLHEARLLLEQKRVASELDRRVAQRTAELAAINDELRKEIAERHRAEEALLESELNSRLILHSIPGLVCTMSPAGEVDRFNPQILEYFGKTPEELKRWATSDAVHPDDVPRVVAASRIRSQPELLTTLSTAAAGRMVFIDGSRPAPFPCGIQPSELPAGTSC